MYEDKGNNELRFKTTTSDGAARPGIPNADLLQVCGFILSVYYDGSNAMIYLNGVMKGSLPLTGTVNPGQEATLGKSGVSFFNGTIDQ